MQPNENWPIFKFQADLDDQASVTKAVEGSYGVFAVTNFWEKASAAIEIQQGKNVADACKNAGVQHLIWSSLINVTKRTSSIISCWIGELLIDGSSSDSRKAKSGTPLWQQGRSWGVHP
jgi:uncharacterized protein YbjT (DUF2867 family)